jgi:DNA-binding response OmpR family regulator
MSDDSPAQKSSAKILLVDGNRNGLTARGMILREHGYTVVTAPTGEDGWKLVQDGHFDVLVTAYGLRGLNGAELISKMHRAGLPARCILLMTHAESLSLDAKGMGADETISKSNREVTELLRAVRRLAEGNPKKRPVTPQRGPSPGRKRKAAGA